MRRFFSFFFLFLFFSFCVAEETIFTPGSKIVFNYVFPVKIFSNQKHEGFLLRLEIPPFWDKFTDESKNKSIIATYQNKIIPAYLENNTIWVRVPSLKANVEERIVFDFVDSEKLYSKEEVLNGSKEVKDVSIFYLPQEQKNTVYFEPFQKIRFTMSHKMPKEIKWFLNNKLIGKGDTTVFGLMEYNHKKARLCASISDLNICNMYSFVKVFEEKDFLLKAEYLKSSDSNKTVFFVDHDLGRLNECAAILCINKIKFCNKDIPCEIISTRNRSIVFVRNSNEICDNGYILLGCKDEFAEKTSGLFKIDEKVINIPMEELINSSRKRAYVLYLYSNKDSSYSLKINSTIKPFFTNKFSLIAMAFSGFVYGSGSWELLNYAKDSNIMLSIYPNSPIYGYATVADVGNIKSVKVLLPDIKDVEEPKPNVIIFEVDAYTNENIFLIVNGELTDFSFEKNCKPDYEKKIYVCRYEHYEDIYSYEIYYEANGKKFVLYEKSPPHNNVPKKNEESQTVKILGKKKTKQAQQDPPFQKLTGTTNDVNKGSSLELKFRRPSKENKKIKMNFNMPKSLTTHQNQTAEILKNKGIDWKLLLLLAFPVILLIMLLILISTDFKLSILGNSKRKKEKIKIPYMKI